MATIPQLRINSPAALTIPKTIHQVWIQGSSCIPVRYKWTSATWRQQNEGFDYTLWDEEMLRRLMAREVPGWLALYERQPEVIARADIARYALLQAFGGLYADIDTECVRPVLQMLGHGRATLFIQLYDQLWTRQIDRKINYEQVANSIIACSPGHSIWNLVLEEIERTPGWQCITCRTGPAMLGPVIKAYALEHPADVCFWDHRQILTSFYLPRFAMRFCAAVDRRLCVLDFNDTARRVFKSWLRRPLQRL